MTLPSFLVIGAQKCGTTWLEANLGQHPEVSTPHFKELHFFDKRHVFAKGAEWYRAQFKGSPEARASGEFTPNYFWIPATPEEAVESGQLGGIPERIREHCPEVRLILTLRHPVDRAISAYYHHIRARRVRPDEPLASVMHRYGIRSMGEYGRQLEEWLAVFPLERFLILHYEEDIVANPVMTYARISRFLDIDEGFRPSDIARRRNPRNSHFLLHLNHRLPPLARFIQKFWPTFGSGWERFRITVTDGERESLQNHYRPDILKLETLIGRKMNWE